MTETELLLRCYAVQGLVAEAGRIALDYFSRKDSLGVTMKGAQDWLTVADGIIESFLRERLAELFPQDTVIGEEGGGEASDAVWIIDPIDGNAMRPPRRARSRATDRRLRQYSRHDLPPKFHPAAFRVLSSLRRLARVEQQASGGAGRFCAADRPLR
uniref:inositol monophosphatase family protein n=1 Tax=Bradyrhizobium sp. (strain ORS 278) TaxID=114615 RepID=UPI0002F12B16|nr:inositol monophosphatase family protein [Bradyrhizobium sp. ORS 278]